MKCPYCEIELDEARILDSDAHESRVAGGTDAEAWFWDWRLSCQGCLGVVSISQTLGAGPNVTAVRSGAEVARLRDRLADAEKRGSLESDVRELLAKEILVLGIPELFPFLKSALGGEWRLATNADSIPDDARVDLEPGPTTRPAQLAGRKRGGAHAKGTALTLHGVRERQLVFRLPDGTRVLAPVHLVSLDGNEAAGTLVVRTATG